MKASLGLFSHSVCSSPGRSKPQLKVLHIASPERHAMYDTKHKDSLPILQTSSPSKNLSITPWTIRTPPRRRSARQSLSPSITTSTKLTLRRRPRTRSRHERPLPSAAPNSRIPSFRRRKSILVAIAAAPSSQAPRRMRLHLPNRLRHPRQVSFRLCQFPQFIFGAREPSHRRLSSSSPSHHALITTRALARQRPCLYLRLNSSSSSSCTRWVHCLVAQEWIWSRSAGSRGRARAARRRRGRL
jgi:hypothetical protein